MIRRYSRKNNPTEVLKTSPNVTVLGGPETTAGGELASEQMAELAQEMLDSDQKVEMNRQHTITRTGDALSTEENELVLDMNNLKDMPFLDFLNLHKIYPKIFMLKMDSHSLQS